MILHQYMHEQSVKIVRKRNKYYGQKVAQLQAAVKGCLDHKKYSFSYFSKLHVLKLLFDRSAEQVINTL
jgi:hypothetical protein